ncbi:CBN-CAL-5 protein [Aphelenchoides besseyi]|nr:CBN-CAL-5 protein [Aphelenchoides besseyi]
MPDINKPLSLYQSYEAIGSNTYDLMLTDIREVRLMHVSHFLAIIQKKEGLRREHRFQRLGTLSSSFEQRAPSEFLTIARANPLSLSLKAVFKELDVDGDGHITRSELRTAFQRMGHALTDQEIKAIYKHVDLNHDGKINFKEFCQMMTRNKK